jgi:23S rRNA (cytidine1920-2'-O)/16S rRNA (cytidine1409-2'-O)-methyltransferase
MKERVDVLLVERGLFESREKARRAIMAGLVYSGDARIDKPGTKVAADSDLRVKGKVMPYVGRGGLKLEKALKVFPFSVQDKIMLDIGASTGGFTDCALQNGARLVYALDVGYNQLAWKLRQDERVVVMERMNFRYAKPEDFQHGLPQIATIDVSFISLKLIIPVLYQILVPNGEAIALIKPQFEAGREEVGKKGIVHDPDTHKKVLNDLLPFFNQEGFDVVGLDFSPITGGDGNIEFLAMLARKIDGKGDTHLAPDAVDRVIREAHQALKG